MFDDRRVDVIFKSFLAKVTPTVRSCVHSHMIRTHLTTYSNQLRHETDVYIVITLQFLHSKFFFSPLTLIEIF